MKYFGLARITQPFAVRPLTGAGIEIVLMITGVSAGRVRPLTGAGIEIGPPCSDDTRRQFAPSRGRELKYHDYNVDDRFRVRPLAGAGIEIRIPRAIPLANCTFAPSRGRELK